ncbi:SusC/RagA family TonB-linked outer membrane protein [Chitinophaga nivalis]|uniref:SusC/RagA family TonB-linked outer membrane protein n=1 Tax=Chitinophaga nivalis TaxID=2991709 RepID=A0ABT3IF51_9BACT|nr:SusC/RagA family TonB-linked outer membrane protein [Chitinophaga nivalis]MCW3467900.1 SusC/RagA family TonB-linked outer membrane protein [Chitinophaga nivalis]MCW3482409.1 SusC/RagA family TonB-linked outer membrane protein [Chitinophaga nivalis]
MLLCVLFTVICLESRAVSVTNEQIQEKLENVLNKMEKKYNIVFVYDASVISKDMHIDLNPDNLSMQQALTQLSNKGIAFKVIGDKVILTRQTTPTPQQQEQVTVKGRVGTRAENGDVTFGPGISIVEKGTSNGTATDSKGEFTLKVKPGAILVFSMIGFKAQEVKQSGDKPIIISLEENITSLNQVVVTGYQTIDRKLFTGSASTLKAADVKRDGISDVSRMLEGRVAGVSIQNVSGTFGAAPKIRVRGATSITGDNKPLWVVDGVVLEDVVNISNEQLSTGDPSTLLGSSVAGLNPDDIESFQILKDAAATAMYGARAMNGVVVITTKKGRIGKPLISYTGNFSTYIKPTYNDFNILNSADQMSVYKSMESRGMLLYSKVATVPDGGVFSKLADKINDRTVYNDDKSKNEFLKRYALANTDWFDVLFRNSLMQEHSLSISSGTEKSQLYFSTSFLNDNGWTIGDKVKRFTGNARANFNISPKLTVGLITQGSIRDQRAPGSVGRVSNAVEGKFDRDFDINPFSYALNTSRTMTAYDENGNLEYFKRNFAPFNIINELQNNTLDLTMVDLKLQGEATYKITPTLKYTFLGALRYAKTNREHKVRESANMAMAYRAADNADVVNKNKFLYRDPDDPEAYPAVVLPYGGFYNTNDDYLVSYNVRNALEWSKTYHDTHMFMVYASQELRYANRQNKFNNGYGYQFDKGGVPYVDPRIIKQAVEGNFDFYGMTNYYDRFLAYMANAAYSYKGKYNINGTVRYDGSNLLGKSRNARWLPTWNISGSWNLDTEDFMKQQDLINRMTLRATYGLTASLQGKATNSSLITRSSKTYRPYLPEIETVINIDDLENSELTWEKQYETNIGIDIGMFKERLTVTIDGYNRNGFDLISPIRTSGIGGQFIKNANYADMKSKGLELTVGGAIIQQKDWGWRSQVNVAWNENKITNLKTNPNIWDLVRPDGGPRLDHPYRGLYSIDMEKLTSTDGTPVFTTEKGESRNDVNLQSDAIKYLKYNGPVDPKVTGGFYNAFRYKNLTLSALVTFSAGNVIRLNPAFSQTYTDLTAMPREFLDRWQMTGDENITNVPALSDLRVINKLTGITPYYTYNYSTARVADGGFIRMKQIALNYSLPVKYTAAIGFSNASLTLIANNPFLIYSDSKLKGQDPEFFQSGGVALPIPKQYTLSVKVGF